MLAHTCCSHGRTETPALCTLLLSFAGSMRMVDEVVVGEGHEPGLDFKDHFLRIRPQLLVVTEDDKYADVKRQLCAEVRAWARLQ